MTKIAPALVLLAALLTAPRPGLCAQRPSASPFKAKLDTKIAVFDSHGRSLAENLLDIVYSYRLPTALEYADRQAVLRPVHIRLKNVSVRDALVSLIREFPEYRIDLSDGIVEVFSTAARSNPSNVLNTTVGRFEVKDETAQAALWSLWESLHAQLQPRTSFLGSYLDNRAQPQLSLDLRNKRAYEILNAIIVKDGGSMWTVTVRPQGLSSFSTASWRIYPLQPYFKDVVVNILRGLFAR